jgi:hypothetical protein
MIRSAHDSQIARVVPGILHRQTSFADTSTLRVLSTQHMQPDLVIVLITFVTLLASSV